MFDKNKPYGEVSGTDIHYKYVQNGKFYLMDGTEVDEKGGEVKERVIKPKRSTKDVSPRVT